MHRTVAVAVIGAVLAVPTGARARDLAQETRNEKLVIRFYDALFNGHDLGAIDRYIGPTYIQHNPMAADGKAALKRFLAPYFAAEPQSRVTVTQTATNGDLVFLHTHFQKDAADPGNAVVDIFRVAHGKIVEHWDVVQPVPPGKSRSGHTMF